MIVSVWFEGWCYILYYNYRMRVLYYSFFILVFKVEALIRDRVRGRRWVSVVKMYLLIGIIKFFFFENNRYRYLKVFVSINEFNLMEKKSY